MPSVSRVGSDDSAIAPVIDERVLGCRKHGVAVRSDDGGDVAVGREDGVLHGGWGEGRAEDEVDDGAAVLCQFFGVVYASRRST